MTQYLAGGADAAVPVLRLLSTSCQAHAPRSLPSSPLLCHRQGSLPRPLPLPPPHHTMISSAHRACLPLHPTWIIFSVRESRAEVPSSRIRICLLGRETEKAQEGRTGHKTAEVVRVLSSAGRQEAGHAGACLMRASQATEPLNCCPALPCLSASYSTLSLPGWPVRTTHLRAAQHCAGKCYSLLLAAAEAQAALPHNG